MSWASCCRRLLASAGWYAAAILSAGSFEQAASATCCLLVLGESANPCSCPWPIFVKLMSESFMHLLMRGTQKTTMPRRGQRLGMVVDGAVSEAQHWSRFDRREAVRFSRPGTRERGVSRTPHHGIEQRRERVDVEAALVVGERQTRDAQLPHHHGGVVAPAELDGRAVDGSSATARTRTLMAPRGTSAGTMTVANASGPSPAGAAGAVTSTSAKAPAAVVAELPAASVAVARMQ